MKSVSNVMLEMLKYFGVRDIPEPLNLPHHPPIKVAK